MVRALVCHLGAPSPFVMLLLPLVSFLLLLLTLPSLLLVLVTMLLFDIDADEEA